jgi:putative membrane protein
MDLRLPSALPVRHARLPRVLGATLLLFWLALAWRPVSRQDWLLENLLLFCTVVWLIDCYFRRPFSALSWWCFFIFLSLHTVGAHYTYALVPIGDWFGGRNDYDRWVHFMYGFLFAAPAAEVVARNTRATGFALLSATVLFLASQSAIYEVIEYGAARIFGGDLGQAYLGTQGDEWDAQKDMLLLMVGAILGALCLALIVAMQRIRSARPQI